MTAVSGLPNIAAERTIAAARVLLAATALFAIWLDSAEPARFVSESYALHSAYVAYMPSSSRA
jgi:hypothetical protein